MDARKEYRFTIKIGAKTDTADSAGNIIETSDYTPSKEECLAICSQFIGKIEQTPPPYSALKINGKRAYKLARNGEEVKIKPRIIEIFDLKCTDYDEKNQTVSYICECSKGTYIRTLAEDICLSLQSLGFVLRLARSRVGMFAESNAINISNIAEQNLDEIKELFHQRYLRLEKVLDDIPVLDASEEQVRKIRFGQKCMFEAPNYGFLWIRSEGNIVAIGNIESGIFKSSRVFNV